MGEANQILKLLLATCRPAIDGYMKEITAIYSEIRLLTRDYIVPKSLMQIFVILEMMFPFTNAISGRDAISTRAFGIDFAFPDWIDVAPVQYVSEAPGSSVQTRVVVGRLGEPQPAIPDAEQTPSPSVQNSTITTRFFAEEGQQQSTKQRIPSEILRKLELKIWTLVDQLTLGDKSLLHFMDANISRPGVCIAETAPLFRNLTVIISMVITLRSMAYKVRDVLNPPAGQ